MPERRRFGRRIRTSRSCWAAFRRSIRRFIELLAGYGVLDAVDIVAVHGFPLDWNHWNISEWPKKLDEIRAVVEAKAIWVSEAGASSFGAEEVQLFGLQKTAELLLPLVERVHWYSLFDLPATWTATTRHKEAEGSAYYRHYYMGLFREDGSPKLAAANFPAGLGVCQWFHFEDHRLELGVSGDCANWGCGRCAPASVGQTGFVRPRRRGSTARCRRSRNSIPPSPCALRRSIWGSLLITPVLPRMPADFAEFARWSVLRYAPRGRTSGVSAPSERAIVVGAEEAMSKKILVTGGAGFVGSHTVDALLRAGPLGAGV